MAKSIIIYDFETYSDVDLKEYGAWAYAHHPSTEILMCAYYDPKAHDSVQVAIGEEAIRAIPGLFSPDTVKVAHNAPFERHMIKGRFGTLPPPEEYIDTAAYAACYGLPRKLKDLAIALGVAQKDEAGTRLINKFSKPQTRKGVAFRRDLMSDPLDFMRFVDYCKQDVWVTYEILKVLSRQPFMQTDREKKVYYLSEQISDRGVPVSVEYAESAAALVAEDVARHEEAFTALSGVTKARSVQQVRAWLEQQGVPLGKSIDKDAVDALLARDDLSPHVREALELKKNITAGSLARFQTIRDFGSADGHLHGCLVYHGAHTGRYVGKGINLQNLPNVSFSSDRETVAALEQVKGGQWLGRDDMKKLIRACLKGPWIVSDFSAVEARVLAWLAGEQWVLDTFEAGKDIYVQTASMMYGVDYEEARQYRKQGKVAVLACGYSGSQGAIQAFSGDTFTREERQSMVDKYRHANPQIRAFWDKALRAFTHGGKIGDFVTVEVIGKTRKVILPSGRALFYHDVSFEKRPLTYVGRDGVEVTTKVMTPTFSKGGRRDVTSGGRLTENVTQAVARDLLVEALMRLDEKGFDVRCHVHDEVLVLKKEGDSAEEVTSLMSVTPEWAPGLPLEADTYECAVYRKE